MKTLKYFENLQTVIKKLDYEKFDNCASIIVDNFSKKNKIMTCGNGGSATTASHFITDWVKMAMTEKNRQIDAICLSDNIGMLTAYANDIDYNSVFSEQVKSYGNSGDLLICVSGSGNSMNLLNAVDTAIKHNIKTMAVVGYDGGELMKKCDYNIHIPSYDMQICEDLHLTFGHIVMKKICKI